MIAKCQFNIINPIIDDLMAHAFHCARKKINEIVTHGLNQRNFKLHNRNIFPIQTLSTLLKVCFYDQMKEYINNINNLLSKILSKIHEEKNNNQDIQFEDVSEDEWDTNKVKITIGDIKKQEDIIKQHYYKNILDIISILDKTVFVRKDNDHDDQYKLFFIFL